MKEIDQEVDLINAVEQRFGVVAHDIDTLGTTLDVAEFPVLVSGFPDLEKLRIFDSDFVAAATGEDPVFHAGGVDPKRWMGMIGAFGDSTDNHFAFAGLTDKGAYDNVKVRKGFRFVGEQDSLWFLETSELLLYNRSSGTGHCQMRKFPTARIQMMSDVDAVLKSIEKLAAT